jgi:threonine aldolase
MVVDLRSDTVTKPTKAMLEYMLQAEVGDDVFGEDPTVNALEQRMAKLFGHEAALFVPSGTMANQIALKAQTQPMDEIIGHQLCHIYYYETAGYAFNSGVSIKLASGNRGILTARDVKDNIQPDYDWLPKTSLVTIENTCNKGGGNCYELENMKAIAAVCHQNNLKLHLDGARIFNAIAFKGYSPIEIGPLFSSISVCFSKGLGAPVGSILISDIATIKKARRIRKVFGGGMRQSGLLAAACEYALDNHIEKLKADHLRAQIFGNILEELSWVKYVHPIETNIILFDLAEGIKIENALQKMNQLGIKMVAFGANTIRAVFHLEVNDEQLTYVDEKLKEIAF